MREKISSNNNNMSMKNMSYTHLGFQKAGKLQAGKPLHPIGGQGKKGKGVRFFLSSDWGSSLSRTNQKRLLRERALIQGLGSNFMGGGETKATVGLFQEDRSQTTRQKQEKEWGFIM